VLGVVLPISSGKWELGGKFAQAKNNNNASAPAMGVVDLNPRVNLGFKLVIFHLFFLFFLFFIFSFHF
jgi:hypothetical protein